jgi:hypothetical protein
MMKNWNYDEISPITGNKSVVTVDGFKLCLETGYAMMQWSEEFEAKIPSVVKESLTIDSSGQKWFKLIQFSKNAILYPNFDGTWETNTFRDRYIDENYDYDVTRKVPHAAGGMVEQVLDPNFARHFFTFPEAFEDFQKIKNNED